MSRTFVACKSKVHNRGKPPESFLNEIIDWARSAPEEIFQHNELHDIYSNVVADLGPWQSLAHRKAAMLEVLRVLGGFESSWKWEEGVDVTNPDSNTPCTEEAGIFQCSGNSMSFDATLKVFCCKQGDKRIAKHSRVKLHRITSSPLSTALGLSDSR
jgi:hypothetical protein